jgi:hypothetical protein
MSFNVLVIPEDFIKDQGILKPLIGKLLEKAGKAKASVRVCQNPRLAGIGQALNKARIAEVVTMYPMVDLFLLCVDRDGKETRRQRLDNIEQHVLTTCEKPLLAEQAWQEIEVWVLAGLDLPKDWSWKDIRAEIDPKETYYLPLAEQEGLIGRPDQGRSELTRRALSNLPRIRARCPEDIQALHKRIASL